LLQVSSNNSSVYTGLNLENTSTTGTGSGVRIAWTQGGVIKSSINANTFGGDYMAFNVGSNTERMTILASGFVGIGNASPGVSLQVTGGIRARGGAPGANGVNNNGYSFAGNGGDTDGGMFSSADGTVDFYTDSARQVTITSAGFLQFNSGYGGVATAYGCRAWVNFNGTGTVSIRSSGNVSSITDQGTGAYRVNLTNAMPDANYSAVISVGRGTDDYNAVTALSGENFTSSTFAIRTGFHNTFSQSDFPYNTVAVFR
jgi:hypothetical protein